MGTGFSGLLGGENNNINIGAPGIEDIPESCVALILTYLDTTEICKLACLNRAFYRASSADLLWESKLPENYQILVKKLFNFERTENLVKKDIYAMLCRPNRFDGGTKEVWLEKNGGGVCVCVSWKGLKITGIHDRRYWNHISTHESRFHTITYLQQIWWLEIEGELEFEFPAGAYSLFFRLQLGKRQGMSNPKKVHGWDIKPVRFKLSNGEHAAIAHECYLSDDQAGKWLHYHVGDFLVENSYVPTKINFSMAQIDCTHTKAGLSLDSVFICPTHHAHDVRTYVRALSQKRKHPSDSHPGSSSAPSPVHEPTLVRSPSPKNIHVDPSPIHNQSMPSPPRQSTSEFQHDAMASPTVWPRFNANFPFQLFDAFVRETDDHRFGNSSNGDLLSEGMSYLAKANAVFGRLRPRSIEAKSEEEAMRKENAILKSALARERTQRESVLHTNEGLRKELAQAKGDAKTSNEELKSTKAQYEEIVKMNVDLVQRSEIRMEKIKELKADAKILTKTIQKLELAETRHLNKRQKLEEEIRELKALRDLGPPLTDDLRKQIDEISAFYVMTSA